MPEPLTHDLRVDASLERGRGVAVPQVVKADVWQAAPGGQAGEPLPQHVGMYRPAVLPGEHPVRVLVVALEGGSLGTLLRPPLSQDIRRGAVDREQPKGIAGLAVAVLSLTIDYHPGRGLDGHGAGLEVDARPTQTTQ